MAVGILVDDEELLHIALKGLSKYFNSFRSTIYTRSTQLTFDELTTLLNAKEESFTERVEIKDSFTLAANARPENTNFSNSRFVFYANACPLDSCWFRESKDEFDYININLGLRKALSWSSTSDAPIRQKCHCIGI